MSDGVAINDVIQIAPTVCSPCAGCFAIVSDVTHWGVKAYVKVPGQEGLAYVRLEHEQFERIGTAVWALAAHQEDQ